MLRIVVNNLERSMQSRIEQVIASAVSYIDRLSAASIPSLPTGTCIFSGTAGQRPLKLIVAKLDDNERPRSSTPEFSKEIPLTDQLATGRKLRVLTIVDTFSRFSPALEPRFTFRGVDVVEVLERVGREVGFPATIRVDQGTEFVSRDLDLWAYHRGVVLDFSRPGKPTDNAFIESLNGKFRAECLNAHWFMSLDDAQRKCEAWRRDYNEERPHSAIGNKPPITLVNRSAAIGPPLIE